MDYYQILGVCKESDSSNIKSAYKKLAIKYHPDRHIDINIKKECEEKFKLISEAYQVLSDPEKKKKYDLYNQIDFSDFQDPSDIFKSIFQSIPSEYIELYGNFLDKVLNSPELELTNKVFEKYIPENKYLSSIKNLIYYINQNIDNYNNRSFPGFNKFNNQSNNNYPDTQKYQDSKKYQSKNNDQHSVDDLQQDNKIKKQLDKTTSYQISENNIKSENNEDKENKDKYKEQNKDIDSSNSNCNKLKKTDNIITTIFVTLEEVYRKEYKRIDINRIRKDLHNNYIKEKKTFIIPIFQEKIIFKQEADQLPEYEMAGDIIINLKITDHPLFQRLKNNNLLLNIDVTLYEYYYGATKRVTFLDDSKIFINSGQNLHKSNLKKITSKGLPFDNDKFGDLYIKFNLRLPDFDLNNNKINKLLFTNFNDLEGISQNPEINYNYSQTFFLDTETCETSNSSLSILSSYIEDSQDSEI